MRNTFLTCSNCVRWGMPWKLARRFVLCHERKDNEGVIYSPESVACKYFIPKQQSLPKDLQTLRLIAQTLTEEQLQYVKFAAEQALNTMNVRDAVGEYLALGDDVGFEHEGSKYYGTVEGVDPQTGSLCINCLSFNANSVLIPAELVAKTPPDFIRSRLKSSSAEDLELGLRKCLTRIAELRSKQTLDAEGYKDLLTFEERYANMKSKISFSQILKVLTEGI